MSSHCFNNFISLEALKTVWKTTLLNQDNFKLRFTLPVPCVCVHVGVHACMRACMNEFNV